MNKKVNGETVGQEVKSPKRRWINEWKFQPTRYTIFVLVIPFLLYFSSCVRRQGEGDFIAYTGLRTALNSNAKIGVMAYSKPTTYSDLLGSTANEDAPLIELHTLRTIVESALVANGFNVVRDDVYDLLTSTNYQLLGVGALNGKSTVKSKAQMLFAETWFTLEKKLLEETGATDLLVISMIDTYKYNVSLIDVRTKSVITSFAINADSTDGWDSFFKPLSNKPWVDYNSDYEGQYYAWGQLADKIVSLLEGKR